MGRQGSGWWEVRGDLEHLGYMKLHNYTVHMHYDM